MLKNNNPVASIGPSPASWTCDAHHTSLRRKFDELEEHEKYYEDPIIRQQQRVSIELRTRTFHRRNHHQSQTKKKTFESQSNDSRSNSLGSRKVPFGCK